MGSYQDYAQYLSNPNVVAFLAAIADGEGANYNTYYGGGTFNNNGPHPCRTVTAGKYSSTAAGRYQFLCSTWQGLVNNYGLPNYMSSQNQDIGAIILLSGLQAIAPLMRGDLQTAIQRANHTWPSLSGGTQQTRTYAQNLNTYNRNGGILSAAVPVDQVDQTAGAGVPDQSNSSTDNSVDNSAGLDVLSLDSTGDLSIVDPNAANVPVTDNAGLCEALGLGLGGLVLLYFILK